ncbi:MAG: hypothetical protein Q8L22_07435 [Reyranella sp.]|nr:hypothetical protein [Reyranella sp.]
MSIHKLQVIETVDPNTRVIDFDGLGPLMRGTGSVSYLCGACGDVLIEKILRELHPLPVQPGQVPPTVIRCGKCRANNAIP